MVWDGITKGDLGLELILIPFRCLPIYRHLKKEKSKERNKCSLRAARFSAQNMAENLAPK